MSEEIIIREFIFPQDYAACGLIWKNASGGVSFSPSDTYEEIQKKMEYSPELFLVAEVGKTIIGTVIGGFDGRRGMVYHLAVLPGYRGQGVGSALMQEIEKRLRSKGCLKIYLMIKSDQPELLDYYGKLGWQPMDVIVAAKEFYQK